MYRCVIYRRWQSGSHAISTRKLLNVQLPVLCLVEPVELRLHKPHPLLFRNLALFFGVDQEQQFLACSSPIASRSCGFGVVALVCASAIAMMVPAIAVSASNLRIFIAHDMICLLEMPVQT